MEEYPQDRTLTMDTADFDAIYEGESAFQAKEIKLGGIPWDIGEPQPILVELERAGRIRGDVLDAGCGLGENTLYLAERGYRVWGFDAATAAIRHARHQGQQRGIPAEFAVADVTHLEGVDQHFDTVLDSALYHCLSDEQRRIYSATLHRVTTPEAQLHLFCFSDAEPEALSGHSVVSQENLHANLDSRWKIITIQLRRYTSAFTRESLRQLLSQYDVAKAGLVFNPDSLITDEQGRIMIPIWQVHAQRI
jgi:SAM-dependent methyltransferase